MGVPALHGPAPLGVHYFLGSCCDILSLALGTHFFFLICMMRLCLLCQRSLGRRFREFTFSLGGSASRSLKAGSEGPDWLASITEYTDSIKNCMESLKEKVTSLSKRRRGELVFSVSGHIGFCDPSCVRWHVVCACFWFLGGDYFFFLLRV